MEAGNTKLASDEGRAFVDGYAAQKTRGWLTDHNNASKKAVETQNATYKKEASAILSRSLGQQGQKIMAGYSDRLDGITSQARSVFLDAENEGGVGAGLDAVHKFVKQQSASVHQEYGNNHLLNHGKGMTEKQAEFAVASAAMAGVASTTDMPDNHTGNGTIGLSMDNLVEHEKSPMGVFERVAGAATGSLLTSAAGALGMKGAGSIIGRGMEKYRASAAAKGAASSGGQLELWSLPNKKEAEGIFKRAAKLTGKVLSPVGKAAFAGETAYSAVEAGMGAYFKNHERAVHDVNAASPRDNEGSVALTTKARTNANDVLNGPGLGDTNYKTTDASDVAASAGNEAEKIIRNLIGNI